MLSPCWENQSSARADRLDIPGIPVAAASFPKTDGHWLGKAATSWDKDIWHHGFRGPSKNVYRQSIPMWGRCCTVKSKQQQGELQTPQVGWEGPTPPRPVYLLKQQPDTSGSQRTDYWGTDLCCNWLEWEGAWLRRDATRFCVQVNRTGICPVVYLSCHFIKQLTWDFGALLSSQDRTVGTVSACL